MKNNLRIRHTISWVLLVTWSLILVACSDDQKKDVTGPVVEPPPKSEPLETLLASGLGESPPISQDSAQLSIEFYQETGNESSISAVGQLYIQTFEGFGVCVVPSGVYHIDTTSAGSRDTYSGLIAGINMTASGPAQMELRVNYFSLITAQSMLKSCSKQSFPSELLGQVLVLSVDGVDCAGKTLTFNGRDNISSSQFSCP